MRHLRSSGFIGTFRQERNYSHASACKFRRMLGTKILAPADLTFFLERRRRGRKDLIAFDVANARYEADSSSESGAR